MRVLEVVEYSASWPDLFLTEKILICETLKDLNITVHHIGSTSVPGLAAKPIIDILLETDRITDLDAYNDIMLSIGFKAKGEFGLPGRRYFQKGERSHQLHAYGRGDPGLERHLAFRDYLRAFPDVCSEYAVLKNALALSCSNNINIYCDGKDAFVKFHEQEALAWAQKNDATRD